MASPRRSSGDRSVIIDAAPTKKAASPTPARTRTTTSDTTPEAFDRQVALLKRYFTLIDTATLDAHRAGGPLPRNPALITFDDGYRDNHDQALPILQRHGAKAVFFVATKYVDERRLYWWERIHRAIGSSTRDRIDMTYPEPRTFDLSMPEHRRASTGALLAIVAAELKRLRSSWNEPPDVGCYRIWKRR